MPRGTPRSVDYDAQLAKIDKKIIDLQNERAALEQKRKESNLKKLFAFLKECNLTAEDAVEALSTDAASAPIPDEKTIV